MAGWMGACMHGWMVGWMVSCLDGWMAEWLGGWMVGWLDGWMEVYVRMQCSGVISFHQRKLGSNLPSYGQIEL